MLDHSPCPTSRIDSHGRFFWESASEFQLGGHWLRHSYALDLLSAPLESNRLAEEFGATCGPASFAALTGATAEETAVCFPYLGQREWTSRRDMQKALKMAGHSFVSCEERWPAVGLCLIHFTGRTTAASYPADILKDTHWVAVLGEYVFDINWSGWLPKRNWEETVVEELLFSAPYRQGWRVHTGFELPITVAIAAQSLHQAAGGNSSSC